MRYFVRYDDVGKLMAIGTGDGATEITETEYAVLMAEIREKAALVNKLYTGEITIADVPVELQEEIQRRVDARISSVLEAEATDDDFIHALAELGVNLNAED